MLYFKHSELVSKYHISLKTVHNWIDAAKNGKLPLALHPINGRTYIANTPSNATALERLAQQRKKYRNSRYHKVVSPKPEFYQLYSRRQILDIISNLDIHREIPRQYNYMDGGADNWDKYAQRMWLEETTNQLKSTVELLHANLGSIDLLLEGRTRVNVIDVGVGNAFPAKELLGHLLERKLLHRYIALDISEDMLHIAKRNIQEWFGNRVKFEGYARDASYERFDDLLVEDMLSSEADQTVNLVLLLGGTPLNLRSPADMFRSISGSMVQNDLLLYTDKPDSETARSYFKFAVRPNGTGGLSPLHSFILELLDIDESLYDVEMAFSEQKRMRFARIRLKQPLTIEFKLPPGGRNVSFEKGDTILVWRVWHLSAQEMVAESQKVGLALLQSSMTKDRQYLLTISGVDSSRD